MLFKKIIGKIRSYLPKRDALTKIELGKDDIAIDCGANIGKITERMAKNGATVYAFEPNPYAYQALLDRVGDLPNVHCFNEAVLDREDTLRLYLHKNAPNDQIRWSQGSSLLVNKGNINPKTFVEVKVIDIVSFIRDLNTPIKVLKMDVEGVEYPIIHKLIDTGLIHQIEYLLVETHERKSPELQIETEKLKERIETEKLTNINLEWM